LLQDFIEDAKFTIAEVRQQGGGKQPSSGAGATHNKTGMPSSADLRHAAALQRLDKLSGVHGTLFEQHRVRYLRAALRGLVHAKLQFHCRAVEELSALHEMLSREGAE
jgi:hypothetical protein